METRRCTRINACENMRNRADKRRALSALDRLSIVQLDKQLTQDTPGENKNGMTTWKGRHAILFKVLTLALVFVFTLQSIGWAEGGILSWSHAKSRGHEDLDLRSNNINILYNTGRVEEFYRGMNDEVIITIQDAHDSISAQHSIVDLLRHLTNNYDLDLIALEGAEGDVDVSLLRTFPDADIREETAEYLMRQGKMSAGEFFSIISEKPVKLYGVEDNTLYKANVEALRDIIGEGGMASIKSIKALSAAFKTLEPYVYSEDIITLNESSVTHSEGERSFTEHWACLLEIAKKRDIKLTAGENISKLLRTMKLEKNIDFKKANSERAVLIDELSKAIPKSELGKLVHKTISFKRGEISQGKFYRNLVRVAERLNISSNSYKNLIGFTRYINVYESIGLSVLFSEVERAEDHIRNNIYKDESEKVLYNLTRAVRLIGKMYTVNLTSSDHDFILRKSEYFNKRLIINFVKEKYLKYRIPFVHNYDLDTIFENLDTAKEFYNIAQKRNSKMIRNTIKEMRANGDRVAALISGGFHTSGLKNVMREKGLSYLIIMPKFETGNEHKRPYIAILTNKKQPYEELLASGEYTLAVRAYLDSHRDEHELYDSIIYSIGREACKGEDLRKIKETWYNAYRDAYDPDESRFVIAVKRFAQLIGLEVNNKGEVVGELEGKGIDAVRISDKKAIIGWNIDGETSHFALARADKGGDWNIKIASRKDRIDFAVVRGEVGDIDIGGRIGEYIKAGMRQDKVFELFDLGSTGTGIEEARRGIIGVASGKLDAERKKIAVSGADEKIPDTFIINAIKNTLKSKGYKLPKNWRYNRDLVDGMNEFVKMVAGGLSFEPETVPTEGLGSPRPKTMVIELEAAPKRTVNKVVEDAVARIIAQFDPRLRAVSDKNERLDRAKGMVREKGLVVLDKEITHICEFKNGKIHVSPKAYDENTYKLRDEVALFDLQHEVFHYLLSPDKEPEAIDRRRHEIAATYLAILYMTTDPRRLRIARGNERIVENIEDWFGIDITEKNSIDILNELPGGAHTVSLDELPLLKNIKEHILAENPDFGDIQADEIYSAVQLIREQETIIGPLEKLRTTLTGLDISERNRKKYIANPYLYALKIMLIQDEDYMIPLRRGKTLGLLEMGLDTLRNGILNLREQGKAPGKITPKMVKAAAREILPDQEEPGVIIAGDVDVAVISPEELVSARPAMEPIEAVTAVNAAPETVDAVPEEAVLPAQDTPETVDDADVDVVSGGQLVPFQPVVERPEEQVLELKQQFLDLVDKFGSREVFAKSLGKGQKLSNESVGIKIPGFKRIVSLYDLVVASVRSKNPAIAYDIEKAPEINRLVDEEIDRLWHSYWTDTIESIGLHTGIHGSYILLRYEDALPEFRYEDVLAESSDNFITFDLTKDGLLELEKTLEELKRSMFIHLGAISNEIISNVDLKNDRYYCFEGQNWVSEIQAWNMFVRIWRLSSARVRRSRIVKGIYAIVLGVVVGFTTYFSLADFSSHPEPAPEPAPEPVPAAADQHGTDESPLDSEAPSSIVPPAIVDTRVAMLNEIEDDEAPPDEEPPVLPLLKKGFNSGKTRVYIYSEEKGRTFVYKLLADGSVGESIEERANVAGKLMPDGTFIVTDEGLLYRKKLDLRITKVMGEEGEFVVWQYSKGAHVTRKAWDRIIVISAESPGEIFCYIDPDSVRAGTLEFYTETVDDTPGSFKQLMIEKASRKDVTVSYDSMVKDERFNEEGNPTKVIYRYKNEEGRTVFQLARRPGENIIYVGFNSDDGNYAEDKWIADLDENGRMVKAGENQTPVFEGRAYYGKDGSRQGLLEYISFERKENDPKPEQGWLSLLGETPKDKEMIGVLGIEQRPSGVTYLFYTKLKGDIPPILVMKVSENKTDHTVKVRKYKTIAPRGVSRLWRGQVWDLVYFTYNGELDKKTAAIKPVSPDGKVRLKQVACYMKDSNTEKYKLLHFQRYEEGQGLLMSVDYTRHDDSGRPIKGIEYTQDPSRPKDWTGTSHFYTYNPDGSSQKSKSKGSKTAKPVEKRWRGWVSEPIRRYTPVRKTGRAVRLPRVRDFRTETFRMEAVESSLEKIIGHRLALGTGPGYIDPDDRNLASVLMDFKEEEGIPKASFELFAEMFEHMRLLSPLFFDTLRVEAEIGRSNTRLDLAVRRAAASRRFWEMQSYRDAERAARSANMRWVRSQSILDTQEARLDLDTDRGRFERSRLILQRWNADIQHRSSYDRINRDLIMQANKRGFDAIIGHLRSVGYKDRAARVIVRNEDINNTLWIAKLLIENYYKRGIREVLAEAYSDDAKKVELGSVISQALRWIPVVLENMERANPVLVKRFTNVPANKTAGENRLGQAFGLFSERVIPYGDSFIKYDDDWKTPVEVITYNTKTGEWMSTYTENHPETRNRGHMFFFDPDRERVLREVYSVDPVNFPDVYETKKFLYDTEGDVSGELITAELNGQTIVLERKTHDGIIFLLQFGDVPPDRIKDAEALFGNNAKAVHRKNWWRWDELVEERSRGPQAVVPREHPEDDVVEAGPVERTEDLVGADTDIPQPIAPDISRRIIIGIPTQGLAEEDRSYLLERVTDMVGGDATFVSLEGDSRRNVEELRRIAEETGALRIAMLDTSLSPDEVEMTIGYFVDKATADIFYATHRDGIENASLEELKAALNVAQPIVSLDLASLERKSLYEFEKATMDMYSRNAGLYSLGIPVFGALRRMASSGKKKYVVYTSELENRGLPISAEIRNRRRALGVTKETDPIRDIFIITDPRITGQNDPKLRENLIRVYMRNKGLEDLIPIEQVICFDKTEDLEIRDIYDEMNQRFGDEIAIKDIVMGGIYYEYKYNEFGEQFDVFTLKPDAEYNLGMYKLMIEMLTRDEDEKRSPLISEDRHRRGWYIYLPPAASVNYKGLLKRYRQYMAEVMSKA